MFRILFTPNEETRQSLLKRGVIKSSDPYTQVTMDGFEDYDSARGYLETNCYGTDADPFVKIQYRIMVYDD